MEEGYNSIFSPHIYKIFLGGILVILALPLLNLSPWFFPPDWGKVMVFRLIMAGLLIVFFFQIFVSQRLSFTYIRHISRNNVILGFLLSLLILSFLATIFSVDTQQSLWGNPVRAGGFVNFLLYVTFAFLSFLIIRNKDWQRIWDGAFFIGILVSLVALFQWFGIFSNILLTDRITITSTLGGPSPLGVYLLLLLFPALSLAFQERTRIKRLYYIFSVVFFSVGILLTSSQAAYLGLILGIAYFLFFYPQTIKKIRVATVTAALILLSSILFLSLSDYQSSTNPLLQAATNWEIDQSRISAWKISLEALKERPLLGYGPENFQVGFDKYYDPALPEINKQPFGAVSDWWDRAHNIFLDVAVATGIPAALVYGALFAALLWSLQQLKKRRSELAVTAHGIQAAFLGYLTANFFGFDSFPTYLIAFLLIGYTLHLTLRHTSSLNTTNTQGKRSLGRTATFGLLVVLLLAFVWQFTIQPLTINAKLNNAKYTAFQGQCDRSIEIMEEALQQKSYLDTYLRRSYVTILRQCQQSELQRQYEFIQRQYELLKESAALQPLHTRTWIFLAALSHALLEGQQSGLVSLSAKQTEQLKTEHALYIQSIQELSPRREDLFIEQAKMHLLTQKYQEAKETILLFTEANSKISTCRWLLGRAEISLGNVKEGEKAIQLALQAKEDPQELTPTALLQLAQAYIIAKDYPKVVKQYELLAEIAPDEPQYLALLATSYREAGEYGKARHTALSILELNPSLQSEIDIFLNTLPQQ